MNGQTDEKAQQEQCRAAARIELVTLPPAGHAGRMDLARRLLLRGDTGTDQPTGRHQQQ